MTPPFKVVKKQASKRSMLDDIAEKLLQHLASSMSATDQPAAIARTHNLSVKTSGQRHLLALPAELREMIYRRLVVYGTHAIHVLAAEKDFCEPPALTVVCQEMRDEALPLFYRENHFIVDVKAYDISALLPWLNRADAFREGDGTKRILSTTDRLCPGEIELTTDIKPHWENLMEWLRLAHAGEVVALGENCYDGDTQTKAVKGAFTAIMDFQKYPWKMAAKVLPGLREMLAAGNDGWLVDYSKSLVNTASRESHGTLVADAGQSGVDIVKEESMVRPEENEAAESLTPTFAAASEEAMDEDDIMLDDIIAQHEARMVESLDYDHEVGVDYANGMW